MKTPVKHAKYTVLGNKLLGICNRGRASPMTHEVCVFGGGGGGGGEGGSKPSRL